MHQPPNNNGTIACTIGGTFLSVLSTIHSDDLLKTCILAVIGATVSFGVSWLLKAVSRFVKRVW